jgi:hypothetical protein
MKTYIPDIEEDIPLPRNAIDAHPQMTPQQELEMRARTIKLIADLTGDPLVPSSKDIDVAEELAKQMYSDNKTRPNFATYPNETIAYLAGMVAQSNHMIVDELSELKMYVVNKLVLEIEQAKDSKSRIMALSKLGEVDGIDAFKRRTEVTHAVKPIEEVEQELLKVLNNLKSRELLNAPEQTQGNIYEHTE